MLVPLFAELKTCMDLLGCGNPRAAAVIRTDNTMTLMEAIVVVLVAASCGIIGEVLAGSLPGSSLFSFGLALTGALIGRWLAIALPLPDLFYVELQTTKFPILWSIAFSALCVFGYRQFRKLWQG